MKQGLLEQALAWAPFMIVAAIALAVACGVVWFIERPENTPEITPQEKTKKL